MGFCFAGIPQAHQYFPAPVVRLDVIGIKFECLGKSIHRCWVVSLFSIHQAEVEMRFGVAGIKREGPCGSARRPRSIDRGDNSTGRGCCAGRAPAERG